MTSARRGGAGQAWAELLRVSALFTVPGDALAGAAAAGRTPNRGTALAVGTSLCLYEAGMVLNDWADRETDARERPGRPLPSGRIRPGTALAAAGAFTGAGLALAAKAGRRTLAEATALAATVWAYDLSLKHTPAAAPAMAAARALDLHLGTTATRAAAGRAAVPLPGQAAPARSAALTAAALLGVHTLAVTGVSRREAEGGSSRAPLAALAAVGGVAGAAARRPGRRADRVLAAGYALAASRPLLHAALNPSPPLVQRAVGGGIRAMIPLQAALAARAGSARTAASLLALLPLARRLSRKVSPT